MEVKGGTQIKIPIGPNVVELIRFVGHDSLIGIGRSIDKDGSDEWGVKIKGKMQDQFQLLKYAYYRKVAVSTRASKSLASWPRISLSFAY